MPDSMQPFRLHVDIVSDVVCPWCIIGFKQLERAAGSLQGELAFTLRWHPFELNPQMPSQGQDLREHMQQKYGSTDAQSMAARERIAELGDELGFPIRNSDESRIYNTFKAHQLLHFAGEHGKQTALKLELFEAYFMHTKNVDDTQVLLDAARHVGLPQDEAAAAVGSERYRNAVRESEQEWINHGISAVPAFILDRKYLVSGARDVAFFVQLLNQLKEQATA